MAISSAKGSSKATTLSLPSPKAPPGYPDLYGKRREISRLHMLEREISVLEANGGFIMSASQNSGGPEYDWGIKISKIKLADIPDAEWDIKRENVLITSSNWLYLANFASFKPTYIPYDDPSDFSFFFDTGGRRLCYLAPKVGLL
ncbi:hypothetical protein HN51_066349 [Arachis hypogaea]